jgi:tetratricopeptide (TPR) repeat protein
LLPKTVWVLAAWLAVGVATAQTPPGPAPAPAPAAPAAPHAVQDPTGLMDDEARQHFQIGKTLYDAGRFPQAAEEFEQAYRLSNRPELLYNMYVAYRDAGNTQKAIESLRGYLEKVPDASDRINLKARLQSMEETAARQAEQERAAAEQARKEAEARSVAQTAAAPAAVQDEPKKTETTATERSIVPWILVGTGGALLVAGTVTGVLALDGASQLEDACPDKTCPEEEADTIDETETLALVTDFLIPGGVAIAGVGLVLFFTGALDAEYEAPAASLGCVSGGCQATYRVRF